MNIQRLVMVPCFQTTPAFDTWVFAACNIPAADWGFCIQSDSKYSYYSKRIPRYCHKVTLGIVCTANLYSQHLMHLVGQKTTKNFKETTSLTRYIALRAIQVSSSPIEPGFPWLANFSSSRLVRMSLISCPCDT